MVTSRLPFSNPLLAAVSVNVPVPVGSVKTPDPLVVVVCEPLLTVAPATGAPFASTTVPEALNFGVPVSCNPLTLLEPIVTFVLENT